MKLKENAELVFERNKVGEIFNTKNRHGELWSRPVNKEIVDTLINTDRFKVAFVDKDGELYLNF